MVGYMVWITATVSEIGCYSKCNVRLLSSSMSVLRWLRACYRERRNNDHLIFGGMSFSMSTETSMIFGV